MDFLDVNEFSVWHYLFFFRNCFAFRPQPALPRKLPSVYLVP